MDLEKKRRHNESNPWVNLPDDVIGLILAKLQTDEASRSVPFVCGSWARTLRRPHCWSVIDIEEWCRRVNDDDVIESVVMRLVLRGEGGMQSLTAYRVSDAAFVFVCNNTNELKVLKAPMSGITDRSIERHVRSLSALTTLDISYCHAITAAGIELIGRSCNIHYLRRTTPPAGIQYASGLIADDRIDESEALAISRSMRGLKKLELAYGRFTDIGLRAIVAKCQKLELLDISGCWHVRMEDEDVVLLCGLITTFIMGWNDDFGEQDSIAEEEAESSESEHEAEPEPEPEPEPEAEPAPEDDSGSDWDWDTWEANLNGGVIEISSDDDDHDVIYISD